MTTLFSGHYLRNRSTLDSGVLGYIGIVQHKEHPPEVFHIPPGTPCIFWFSLKLLPEKFLILIRIERDVIRNVYWSSCKRTGYSYQISIKLELFGHFPKIFKYQMPWKIRPTGEDLFRTGISTDMKKLTVAYKFFVNVTEIQGVS